MSFSFLLISGHTSLPFFNSQAVETMHSSTYMLCVLYKVSNTTINMPLKSCLRFRQLFGTKKYRCCFFKLCSFSSPFLSSPLSHLVTSCLFFFFFFPLSSPPPRLLPARVSRVCAFFICCPTWLRTSQASHLIGPLALPGMKPY